MNLLSDVDQWVFIWYFLLLELGKAILNINNEFFDLDFLDFLQVGFVFRAKTDFFFGLAYSVSFPNIGKIIAFGLIWFIIVVVKR